MCVYEPVLHIVFVPAGCHAVTSLPLQHLQICEVGVQRLDAPGHMTALLPTWIHLSPPLAFFVKLPSFYRYRGGSELMDGEWQHVTLSSTLSCGAVPAESHRPAHVTWQLYSAALWTLSIWIWSLDMLVDEGNIWERKNSGDVDYFYFFFGTLFFFFAVHTNILLIQLWNDHCVNKPIFRYQ